MGRPRKALWESVDRAVYIKAHRGAFLVVDTRGVRREFLRSSFEDAMKIASRCSALDGSAEMTLFELAVGYFAEGLPIWHDGSGVALSVDTIEDRKARFRNHYGPFGSLPLSELPDDVIVRVVEAARRRPRGASKSLQDKLRLEGRALLRWGKHRRVIPRHREFDEPAQRVVQKKVGTDDFVGRVQRPLPSHRALHQLARRANHESGAPYMRLFFWLLAYIGFREGELCALTVDDVVRGHRIHINVTKKVIWRSGSGTVLEHYAKGYKHRTVVVPRVLEGPLVQRVQAVRDEGGTLLFPRWSKRSGASEYIQYSALKELFVRVGAECGWKVVTSAPPRSYTAADGRVRRYREKPQSLEFTLHDLRAFAATTMYEARLGLSLRGMGMSLQAAARQLGDHPETVKRHYLGIIDNGSTTMLDREVP